MNIAIITGASSGLGRLYVRQADKEGAYDQIWAIARRRERLEDLARRCAAEVRCICLDLSCEDAIEELNAMLQAQSPQVGLLVNAAGFGKFGTCDDLGSDEVGAMIDVNCRALVQVTQSVLPYMARGSHIIEIASCAGFQPLPGLGVYAASKSFVLSYTRSLRYELRGRGIHVTAVCPIWIRTEFIKVARETANGTTVKHPWPQISPNRVVAWSTFVNRLNYPVATCSIVSLAMRVFCKVVPASIIMWIWEGVRRV